MHACFDPFQAAATAFQVTFDGLLDPSSLQRVRARRLARLLQTRVTCSPFYGKRLRGVDPKSARLSDPPVAHRGELMQHFDEWVTDSRIRLDELRVLVGRPERLAALYLDRYLMWQSSGTSGEPGIFVQDALAMGVYDALEAVRGPLVRWAMAHPGSVDLQRNLVLIGATEEHYASTVAAERLRKLNPWLRGQLHDLSFLQPMHRLRQALEALNPIVLATFPSVVLQLAEEHLHGRLDIAPQEIWVGGETLTPWTRAFVERVFGCRVRNSYGSSEFLAIAFECAHEALLLNADWVILEPLDERGSPVGPDVEGASVLLTNLANHVQPLLRYVFPDRVSLLSRPCACGSALPVLTVHGRDDDVLHLPGSGGRTVMVTPLAITTVVEERAGLLDYQVRQVSPGTLVLSCGPGQADADAKLRRGVEELSGLLAELGVVGAQVTCDAEGTLEPGPAGKVRRVVGSPKGNRPDP